MTTKNVLMMNGYDQEMVPDDIQPYIKNGGLDTDEIQVVQSNPEQYLGSVLAENPELETLKGALYSGRFISVFPGVMSARMYLKLQNDKSQKAIEKLAEPLALLDYLNGGDYDATTLEKAWELLLKNHPHDSICGVSIDDVHSDMEERTRDFHFLIDHLIRKTAMNLAKRIDTSAMEDVNYFTFNPSTYARKEVVTVDDKDYLVDLPAFGYASLEGGRDTSIAAVTRDGNVIGNGLIEVTVNADGTFDLVDKETEAEYKGLGKLEDAGDAGDEYNYSYPDVDKLFYSTDSDVKVDYISESDLKVAVEVRFDMELPESVVNNRKERSDKMMKMPVRSVYTVEAGSKVVSVKTEILNTVKDHIVRALFPTDIEAKFSYAGSPFDVVERPIHIDDYDESMIPDNVRRVIVGAREAKPNTIFLGRELVDINDGKKGLAVISKGLPEYTVYKGNNAIALTLFRSIDWVAKEINTRIGDAGPEIYTPEAQCLRQMTFEYGVYPHAGHYDEGGVLKAADSFNTELITVVTDRHEGALSANESFVSVEDQTGFVRVTSVKRSRDKKGIVLRMYNGSDKAATVKVNSAFALTGAKRVNFLERDKDELTLDGNGFEIEIKGKVIETLYLTVDQDALVQSEAAAGAYADVYDETVSYNFGEYPSVPMVTLEDIASEEKRAEGWLPKIDNPLFRRTALEAQLSAILTRDRYHEQEVTKLGYGLNEARVKRRVHDYIQDILKKQV